MKALSRDDILKSEDLGSQRVEIPEWGGYAFIRVMTDEDRDGWDEWLWANKEASASSGGSPMLGARRELVARTLVDEHGKRLFANSTELKGKSAKVIDRLFDIASELNALGPRAVAQAKKNSSPDPSSGSDTG